MLLGVKVITRRLPVFALSAGLGLGQGLAIVTAAEISRPEDQAVAVTAAAKSVLDEIDAALDGRRISATNPLRSRDYVRARRLLTNDLANIGGVESQAAIKLAKLLISGRGGPVDLTQAKRILTSALAGQSGEAALLLAELELVDDTEARRAEAERFLRLGMRFGSVDCYLGLARLIGPKAEEGRVAAEVGLKLLEAQTLKPEERGAALIKLGDVNRDGEFLVRDLASAARYYQEASGAGDVRAAVRLGKLFGESGSALFDSSAAREWLLRAANAGDMEAALRLVKDGYFEHRLGTTPEEASRWLKNALEAGDSKAQLIELVLRTLGENEGDESNVLERAGRSDLTVSDLIDVATMSVANDQSPRAVRLAARLFEAAQTHNSSEAGYRRGRLVLENLDAFEANEVTAAIGGLQVAAGAGNSGALSLLARAYRYGIGVEADRQKAKELYEEDIQRSDEARSAEAMLSLGEMLLTSADPLEVQAALSWFEAAAEHGNLEALVALGRIYSAGSITARDPIGAKSLLQEAVSSGSTQGSVELADILADENLASNLNHVIELHQRAIRLGDRRGYDRLVQLYDSPSARRRVESYLREKADAGEFQAKLALLQILSGAQSGSGVPTEDLGRIESIVAAAKSEDERLAVAQVLKGSTQKALLETSERLLRQLWEQGNRVAGTVYATALLDRRYGNERVADGRAIAEQLAGIGWNPARLALGHAWRKGVFGKKEPERAVELYQAVLRDDPRNPEATLYLARALESGEGAARDLSLAARMFSEGASGGDIPSMVELGECYALGLGVTQDRSLARRWLSQAANSGQESAMLTYAEYLSASDESAFAPGEGYDLYVTLARRGSTTAMLRAGRALLAGVGIEQDTDAGLYWLQRAAERNESSAAFELARFWHIQNDLTQSNLWLRKAAQMGNPSAMLRVGIEAMDNGQTEEAKKWLSWAADHESEPALHALRAMAEAETDNQEEVKQ